MEILAMLAGGLFGGVGCWWISHSRTQTQLLRQQHAWQLESARLNAINEETELRIAEVREQWQEQQAEVAALQTRLNSQQQELGLWQGRAARIPSIEAQLANRDQQLELLQAQLLSAQAKLAILDEQSRQLQQARSELSELRQQLQQQHQTQTSLAARERELQTLLEQERLQTQDKLRLLAEARESLSNQFKALAGEILEEKSRRFTEQNQQQLGQLLNPLGERLGAFGKLVQDTYEKDSKERLTLENELRRLTELNTRLGADAEALTNALTGANNKAQGNWGEMVLEKVLESSGLTRGREYQVQVSDYLETENGERRRYQPDVVINLPDSKQLVVDSKVSLNAYVRYTAATDEDTRQQQLKLHIAALRQHIRTLSEKRYQDLYQLNTLDFVFMFVPVEPAYLLAVQHDMELFGEAFERRIMIVGPSTLLATLRTVANIWRNEQQNLNAQEIARQGGALYDKFVGFCDTLEKLGKQLATSQDSYQQAMRQLSSGNGNLIGRAERLRQLGVRNNKQLSMTSDPDEKDLDSSPTAMLDR